MTQTDRFIRLLEDGKIRKQILPNNAPNYSENQEKRDLENYRIFANSFALDELMECEVAPYYGDGQD